MKPLPAPRRCKDYCRAGHSMPTKINSAASELSRARAVSRVQPTMCAWGALRAGAGLVEVFVPENIYEIVAAAAPFESMVKPVKSYRDLIEEKIDVWGIGPGLGKTMHLKLSN